jgi:hypothetical protein
LPPTLQATLTHWPGAIWPGVAEKKLTTGWSLPMGGTAVACAGKTVTFCRPAAVPPGPLTSSV